MHARRTRHPAYGRKDEPGALRLQRDPGPALIEHPRDDAGGLLRGSLRRLPFRMNAAHSGGRRMIERAAPSRLPRLVQAIRQVDRRCIDATTRALADDVRRDRRADEPADFIADAHASVSYDDI